MEVLLEILFDGLVPMFDAMISFFRKKSRLKKINDFMIDHNISFLENKKCSLSKEESKIYYQNKNRNLDTNKPKVLIDSEELNIKSSYVSKAWKLVKENKDKY